MMNKLRRRMKAEEGFTLIELMIVIAVIGVLAAIAVPKMSGVTGKAKVAQVQADFKAVQSALEMYYAEHQAYPTLAQLTSSDYIGSDLSGKLAATKSSTDYGYSVTGTDPQTYTLDFDTASGTTVTLTPENGLVTTP
ncbi:type II secretion system protein G (GspG) [Orenia metallireducens]|uniref:type IV pilin protein n=1 Tax=Orenia metallireducens TaxID=1413210 RepID=UPI000D444530|nr:prepilin-type N-terminal cleavage/methylation domain-containing protein [Orenia metallireducens]PRX31142.1 type II secretion system protein G (GspG) [Orenia metallireducens]